MSYRAFWQRRCRAAAAGAVLKPLGGNYAVLPKAGRSCRRIVSSLRLLYLLAAVTGFPKNPCRAGHVRPAAFLYRPFPFPALCINKKALLKSEQGLKRSRHLPIFTGRFQPTIFGTSELNFCVRNGNRWNLTVIDTGHSHGACHASLLLRMYPQN